MHRIVRLGPVILLALFVGCRDNTAPDQTRSLRLNRLLWENQNLHDYRYTGSLVCGECPSNHGPVFVTVLSDTVSSVKLTTTGVEVSKQGRCHARSSDGFDLHAGLMVAAGQSDRLEQVCRYALLRRCRAIGSG